MNPLFPPDVCIPDGEAHVMPDGRLYVYGSLDTRDDEQYCSHAYRVFSTDDMIHWTDHGQSVFLQEHKLYAPDCLHRDGKYYLYYCTDDGGEGTAVSDRPWGPFTDLKPMNFANHRGIDPAVFMDTDGQAYYFWGQFSLNGAKLREDMRSLDENSVTRNILTEEDHGFHEGASIRKVGDTYYMLYTDITRGRATCISYATAKAPFGPYTRGGVIIDNTGCDPQSWNNHGSMECFHGQWYIFYHRSSRNGNYSRRLCAEKISIGADGRISEVLQTTGGTEDSVDAFQLLEASRASLIRGGYVCTDEQLGERLTACCGNAKRNGIVEYRYLDFGPGASGVRIEARGYGKITVHQNKRELGCVVEICGEAFRTYEVLYRFQPGIHPLRLFIESEHLDIRSVCFFR